MSAPSTIVPRMRQRAGLVVRRPRWERWLLVGPAVVIILLLTIFPLLFSLWLSFVRWDLQVTEHPFVFLKNYAEAVVDPRVWASLRNTVLIVGVGVTLEFVLGLGLALLFMDELRGKRVIIPLLMLPVMMVPIVVAFTWRMLWDAQYGAINQILGLVLNQPVTIAWLAKTDTALLAMIVTEVWQWTPFMFLVLLAGLTSISPEFYEAAAIDGANWWQSLRHITLPALAPVVAVAILFRVLDAFKIFEMVYVFTQGGPGTSTETISWYIYQIGFKFFRMGYAAALSYLVMLLLVVACTLYVKRFLRFEERL